MIKFSLQLHQQKWNAGEYSLSKSDKREHCHIIADADDKYQPQG